MKTRRTIMLIFLAIILLDAYWAGSLWYGKRYQRWVFESSKDGMVYVVSSDDHLYALKPP